MDWQDEEIIENPEEPTLEKAEEEVKKEDSKKEEEAQEVDTVEEIKEGQESKYGI